MKKRGKIKIERNAESVERRTRKRMMMMIYAAVNQLNISAASAKVPSAVRTAERPAPSLRHLGPWGSADTQIQNIQMPGNFKFSRERCKEKKKQMDEKLVLLSVVSQKPRTHISRADE